MEVSVGRVDSKARVLLRECRVLDARREVRVIYLLAQAGDGRQPQSKAQDFPQISHTECYYTVKPQRLWKSDVHCRLWKGDRDAGRYSSTAARTAQLGHTHELQQRVTVSAGSTSAGSICSGGTNFPRTVSPPSR